MLHASGRPLRPVLFLTALLKLQFRVLHYPSRSALQLQAKLELPPQKEVAEPVLQYVELGDSNQHNKPVEEFATEVTTVRPQRQKHLRHWFRVLVKEQSVEEEPGEKTEPS